VALYCSVDNGKIIIIISLNSDALLLSMFQVSVSLTVILNLISSFLLFITGSSAVACIVESIVPKNLIGEQKSQPQRKDKIYEEVKFLDNETVPFSSDVAYQNIPNKL